MKRPALHLPLAVAVALCGGCASGLDPDLVAATDVGRYGGSRVALEKQLTADPSDRNYILDRLRLLILTLADGQPDAAEVIAGQTFSLLSTQGINADKTVSSVVFNESVKIWKGEPFEQAMGYHYIALQKAERGEWDNARASSASSLFLLKDFGDNEKSAAGADLSTEELARRAARQDARNPGAGDDYLDKGYAAVKTDFALGYVINGVSNLAIGRADEANDNFLEAQRLNPSLGTLCDQLRSGKYNTVFVVDYGRGPAKVTYGSDDALVRFQPRQYSDGRGLEVVVASQDGGVVVGGVAESPRVAYPAVCDVNQMAASHMWNNLEDVRSAKSAIGNVLMLGGGGVAIGSRDRKARTAGLIAAGVGLLLKASSSADTRYCEFLPQRVFVFPASIATQSATVSLHISGDDRSRVVLTDLAPPKSGDRFQLRYVRLPNSGPQPWAIGGRTVYANDRRVLPVAGDSLPYIMGGYCVRFPTDDVMEYYRRSGNLTDLTAIQLQNIYREEGVAFTVEDQKGASRKHILEGGDSLVCPLAGTTGYQRLFGQTHTPYQPRSAALRDYLDQHPAVARP